MCELCSANWMISFGKWNLGADSLQLDYSLRDSACGGVSPVERSHADHGCGMAVLGILLLHFPWVSYLLGKLGCSANFSSKNFFFNAARFNFCCQPPRALTKLNWERWCIIRKIWEIGIGYDVNVWWYQDTSFIFTDGYLTVPVSWWGKAIELSTVVSRTLLVGEQKALSEILTYMFTLWPIIPPLGIHSVNKSPPYMKKN